MKTIKLTLIALVMFTSAMASNNKNGLSIGKQIQKQFYLKTPISEAEEVEVLFSTDECGYVNRVSAKTNNIELKNAIESNFLKMKITKSVANTTYKTTVKIKVG